MPNTMGLLSYIIRNLGFSFTFGVKNTIRYVYKKR